MGCVPTAQRDTRLRLGLRNSQIINNRRITSISPKRQLRKSFYHQQPLQSSRVIHPTLRSSQIIIPSHSILSNNMTTQLSSLVAQSHNSLSSIMQPTYSITSIPLPTQTSINSINSQYFQGNPTVFKDVPSINIKGLVTKNTSKINNQNFQHIHIQRMQFNNLTY